VAEEFGEAIRAYLEHRIDAEKIPGGVVVGIVDEQESSIISAGKPDRDTEKRVDGDTLFEIGSVGKTFTALLLQDMIERGQMKLDDPVSLYLPESVKLPTRGGKEITLRHLATHMSGLPGIPDNLGPKHADNPYADYTVEKLYSFLSRYQLTRGPGASSEYSNLGMGLLGHVIALKAAASYESLVVDRICRPLGMDSTTITITPELQAHFAAGHNRFGESVRHWDVSTLEGAGALRSTANDMLKYVSANLGLTPSELTPLMRKTHDMGLAWYEMDMHGTKIIGHGGGTAGCSAFAGFDKAHRRGVVILTNITGVIDTEGLGKFLLVSEWNADHRPTHSNINSEILGSYVGQYQFPTDFAQQMLTLPPFVKNAPKAVTYTAVGLFIAVLIILVWRASSFRKRLFIVGGTIVAGGVVGAVFATASSSAARADSKHGIGIRREGDRLFAQLTGSWPVDEAGTIRSSVLPPVTGELLPISETHFLERLSGNPVLFSRTAQGAVTSSSVQYFGRETCFEKIIDQPPTAPEPLRPRVAVKLDSQLLDACIGQYEFAPNADIPTGMKLSIRRDGDHLMGQGAGKSVIQGTFEIYPQSETTFFIKVDGAQLDFVKNERGEVTAVTHRQAGFPVIEGKKHKD
jgi:CubicO group peptidase (beta-lactamase class C family)